MTTPAHMTAIAEEDLLRADLYGFLAAFLSAPPDAATLARAAELEGDDSPLGQAVGALGRVAAGIKPKAAEREFNKLFIGVGRGELLPYASYYMTGFLNEKPLALLRQDMRRLGIERSPNVFEPEDNISTLCEIMAGLIQGRFGEPAPLALQAEFHGRHLAPWAAHFFADLEGAEHSVLYAPIGTIGRVFMEIEQEAFRLGAAPVM